MASPDWAADPFFQYPTTAWPTSEGPVQLPILYYRASVVIAMFKVDLGCARRLVQDPGLEVIERGAGRALAAIAFYEYRETTIGDYHEAGVALLVKPRRAPTPDWPLLEQLRSLDRRVGGFHVLDLPVTTPAACSAGRELWGYPKFVTPIGFRLDGDVFQGAVKSPEGGSDLLRLEGRSGGWLAGPLLDLVLYSRHEGRLLRTRVVTRGGARVGLGGGLRVQVDGASTHPMASRLRELGLHGARPFIASCSERLQLRLNAGAPLPE